MSTRRLPAVSVAIAAVVLVASCGNDGLDSDAVDDSVDSWVDIVCADDPTVSDEAPGESDAVRYVTCYSSLPDDDITDGERASLAVFEDAASTTSRAKDDPASSDCDVAYSVVVGPRWISKLDGGSRVDELAAAGGTVVCESS